MLAAVPWSVPPLTVIGPPKALPADAVRISTLGPAMVKPLLPVIGSAIVVGAVTVIVGELFIVTALGVASPKGRS